MALKSLQKILDEENIQYEIIHQPERVYTAQEIAASTHIPGGEFAKTVMVKIDGTLAMTVLPASHRVNFSRLKELTGAQKVDLASESDFKDLFPGCEVGAMPPLGNLFGMAVYAAESLAAEMSIVFCAGSHSELIRIAFKDFQKLANPNMLDFSYQN